MCAYVCTSREERCHATRASTCEHVARACDAPGRLVCERVDYTSGLSSLGIISDVMECGVVNELPASLVVWPHVKICFHLLFFFLCFRNVFKKMFLFLTRFTTGTNQNSRIKILWILQTTECFSPIVLESITGKIFRIFFSTIFLHFSRIHLSDTRFHLHVYLSMQPEPHSYGYKRSLLPSFALGSLIISASYSHLLGSCLIDCGARYRYTRDGCW